MSQVHIKTLEDGVQTWQSPDGKINSYDIVVDSNGTRANIHTFSNAIARAGWEGEVEAYEKNGKTYVKQPPREDGGFTRSSFGGSGGFASGITAGRPIYPAKSTAPTRDFSDIKAQFAIKAAIRYLDVVKKEGIDLPDVEALAKEFFKMINRVTHPEEDTVNLNVPMDEQGIKDVFNGIG